MPNEAHHSFVWMTALLLSVAISQPLRLMSEVTISSPKTRPFSVQSVVDITRLGLFTSFCRDCTLFILDCSGSLVEGRALGIEDGRVDVDASSSFEGDDDGAGSFDVVNGTTHVSSFGLMHCTAFHGTELSFLSSLFTVVYLEGRLRTILIGNATFGHHIPKNQGAVIAAGAESDLYMDERAIFLNNGVSSTWNDGPFYWCLGGGGAIFFGNESHTSAADVGTFCVGVVACRLGALYADRSVIDFSEMPIFIESSAGCYRRGGITLLRCGPNMAGIVLPSDAPLSLGERGDFTNNFASFREDRSRGTPLSGRFLWTKHFGCFRSLKALDYEAIVLQVDDDSDECSSGTATAALAITVFLIFALMGVVLYTWRHLTSLAETEEGTEENDGFTPSGSSLRRTIYQDFPVQSVKIVIAVWQIVTQFATAASATYPTMYQCFLNVLDVINPDRLWALSLGCFVGINFHQRLLVMSLGPLIVLAFMGMSYKAALYRSRGGTKKGGRAYDKHASALLQMTFLCYSPVSSVIFEAFGCDELVSGHAYLRADNEVDCNSATHKIFMWYASFMIFLYPVGIPFCYTWLLCANRLDLTSANREDEKSLPKIRSFQDLWRPYRRERYYYEVVECVRRVMLTGAATLMLPGSASQVTVTYLLAFLFFVASEVFDPFVAWQDAWLSRLGHIVVLLTMFFALLLKVDVDNEMQRGRAVFSVVLVAMHIIMLIAVCTECAAVCWVVYQAQRGDAGIEMQQSRRFYGRPKSDVLSSIKGHKRSESLRESNTMEAKIGWL